MGAKIMRTERQQKNHEAYLKQRAKIIRYLNDNEHLVFFFLGLTILAGVIALAVSVS
jgi:hypothetical protein